jgi:hypothetical protein
MTRLCERLRGSITQRSGAAYRILGVSEYATDAEIEQAYLHLIAQYQPDHLVGLAAPIRREVDKKAREVDIAYERIKALRKRPVHRNPEWESSSTAMATSEDRRMTGYLLWVALALIALVTITWLVSLRMQASPQARPPGSAASADAMPASPAVAVPPVPAAPLPVAEVADTARVEDMVVLMPEDPPRALAAPSGEAGLVEALRAGHLRPATGGDLSRWAARWSEANGRSVPAVFRERSGHMTSYVIQKDFTIPDGLNGAHAVIFLLDTRVSYPRGDPGHSVILDLSTGACMGVACSMLLD